MVVVVLAVVDGGGLVALQVLLLAALDVRGQSGNWEGVAFLKGALHIGGQVGLHSLSVSVVSEWLFLLVFVYLSLYFVI